MKTRYLRAGGQNATPAATVKVRYRDLDSLIKRGIVHPAHQPKWLEEYRKQQVLERTAAARPDQYNVHLQQAAQVRNPDTYDLTDGFQGGEQVDLTDD